MSMDALTQDQWLAAVDALGASEAEAWRTRNGIKIIGVDEELPPSSQSTGSPVASEYDGYEDEEGNRPPVLGEAGNAAMGLGGLGGPDEPTDMLTGLYGELGASQAKARDARLQMLQQATDALKARRMGPDTAEKLFAISGALLSPTRTKGFTGSLANLMPVMQRFRSEDRTGEQSREDALLGLRQKYTAEDIGSEQDAIQNKINLYKASRTGGGMGNWSESLGRYIPKDRPVVLQAGSLNGKRTEKLSDGSIRVYESSGVYNTFDAGGNPIPRGN